MRFTPWLRYATLAVIFAIFQLLIFSQMLSFESHSTLHMKERYTAYEAEITRTYTTGQQVVFGNGHGSVHENSGTVRTRRHVYHNKNEQHTIRQ